MEIKKDFRNELFKRNELIVEIEAEKNPSFDEVSEIIAKETGKSKENIDVKKEKNIDLNTAEKDPELMQKFKENIVFKINIINDDLKEKNLL